jgi:hypothetical protein
MLLGDTELAAGQRTARSPRVAFAAKLATLLASGVLLAGCGSGSSKTVTTEAKAGASTSTESLKPASTAPLTRAQLISKTDTICGQINRMVFLNPYRTQADLARLAPQISALEQRTTEEMATFVPPPSLAADWKKLLAVSRRRAQDTGKLGEYAAAGEFSQVTALLSRDAPIEGELLALARRDGFKVCSNPG